MAAMAQSAIKLKTVYRRTESEPANTTVNDIRCRFESAAEAAATPDIGLAFGYKKSTPTSPTSEVTSPITPAKQTDTLAEFKSLFQLKETKTPVVQVKDLKKLQSKEPKSTFRLKETKAAFPAKEVKVTSQAKETKAIYQLKETKTTFQSKDTKPAFQAKETKAASQLKDVNPPSQSKALQCKEPKYLKQEMDRTVVHPKPVKQMSDSKLHILLNKLDQTVTKSAGIADKDKQAPVKPNSLILPNGIQGKHIAIDKPSLICLHNTGIVSSRKQTLRSPISPSVNVPSSKVCKLKTESLSNRHKSSEWNSNEKALNAQPTDPNTRDKISRHSLPEGKSLPLHPAKTFWKSLSIDSDGACLDSVLEPGTDYAKLRKELIPPANGATERPRSPQVGTKTGHLRKGSDTDSRAQILNSLSEESRPTPNTLSKSPSISSTCSSMDSLDIEYINGPFSHKMRRRDTKPPQNIVARRTQLFEKSMDEINSVLEEAEAYNKVKEGGFGTVFTSKEGSLKASEGKLKTTSQPQLDSKPSQSTDPKISVHSNEQLNSFINNNTKLADKNQLGTKPTKQAVKTDKNKNILPSTIDSTKSTSRTKPLPLLPGKHKQLGNETNSLKPPPPPTASKPKSKGPPPKPPRTFEHPSLTPSSSNEMVFDPVVIPRQAGDGEENNDYERYERHVSCQSPHVYTSVTLPADARPYTATTSVDPRPYTSLTTTGGSGGDDSVAGSENAYDTLGKVSVASSYEHYDTISQSELDSDVSRPPTLPRRPSNLRHRPLTTAFSHLDISKSNTVFQNQLHKALSSTAQTIKETSPTSPSPTKIKVPFKLKYLLPKIRRKADEMRKASSMADLLDEKESLYDAVEVLPASTIEKPRSVSALQLLEVPIDEAGYALPDIKGTKRLADATHTRPNEPQQAVKSQVDKATEKIRLKLNQAFSAIRRPVTPVPTQASDGEDDEKPPDPEVLEERLKHCTSVKEHAIYASVEQIKGFMTRVYAQLYDYAVIVGLRKNPDCNVYEPYVKYKFPPQVNVEQTTVPQFCYPDAHIWHKCTDYKSEAFSFVLTDVTGTRQYGYCRRVLPPDLNNLPRTAEVICVVSPLNATKLYNQVLDEVEKRRMQNSVRAEEFLQAVYGRPLPSPGQCVTIRAMNVYEEAESLVFTRSPDSQREGIDYECLLNMLSVSQIIKIFASILLERKIIFIAEKLSALSSCVHAFAALIYPFSWQHTFIPLLPPNLIDVVCAPTPYIVGLLSSNSHLLNSLDDEMEEVLIIDLDNHKFLQRRGDEKSILPKKLHRALLTALDMAKSEGPNLRSAMVAESFLRFFLETTGSFNQFMIHVPGAGRQFQKEEFVCNASNAPSIMVFLQWFTETQMFEVYTTERENDRNVISGTFEERVFEFQSEDHGELLNDSKRFKKFKLFGKNKKR